MTLNDKVDSAERIIKEMLASAKRPAFMCSFGKDSMVLLDLLTKLPIDLPIIFHKDPAYPEKFQFANSIIQEWRLEAHDYAPLAMSMAEGNGALNLVSHYQIGEGVLLLPKNIEAGDECGLKHLLRPTGTFNYPWDSVIIGHKSSDKDNVAGSLALHHYVKSGPINVPNAYFPLINWTDDDIWAYTRQNGVPQQEDRYDIASGKEKPSRSANSDYVHGCFACVDRRNSGCVHCPKIGKDVPVIADKVTYTNTKLDYFGSN
jgi:3'-phosphoadenosine 5'-phosphosulfate sulfotransferase (PAPS reductase)/FAD synthetase